MSPAFWEGFRRGYIQAHLYIVFPVVAVGALWWWLT